MLSHFSPKFRGRNFSKVVSDVTRRTFFRTEFHVTHCPISEPCGPIDSRCASLLHIKAAATRARTHSVSQSDTRHWTLLVAVHRVGRRTIRSGTFVPDVNTLRIRSLTLEDCQSSFGVRIAVDTGLTGRLLDPPCDRQLSCESGSASPVIRRH